jgi:putative hemolysin
MSACVTHTARLIIFLGLIIALGGCSQAATEPTAATTPTPIPAPAGVMMAREAVLAFLREGANECVPPKQAGWTMQTEDDPPAGYEVYRFESGGCMMAITVATDPEEQGHYHVALGDGPTGFCWQAVVDATGQILLTGNAAQTDPTFGNPAQAYCEARGYSFEVVTRAGGDLCGMCVFEDGRACNAWAYFHGACTVENASVMEQ